MLKLKEELTKHGFGAQMLQLKGPNKKEVVALYEKHVIGSSWLLYWWQYVIVLPTPCVLILGFLVGFSVDDTI